MHLSFLAQAASAFALLVESISSGGILRLRRRTSQHWRERGFLRLPQKQRASPETADDGSPPPSQPNTRVFLVGCERSGTTLLQSLLAAHSRIHSVPETHFVKRLFRNEDLPKRYGRRPSWPSRALRTVHAWRRKAMAGAGWISGRNARAAWRDVDSDVVKPSSFRARHSARAHMRSFVDAMDAGCGGAGKRVWIEKTPEHLYYIGLIRRYIPAARFIHIVRDGREVVASLNQLAQRYPQWQPFLDEGAAVERWNDAWRATQRWIGHPDHLVVRYETLLRAPERTLARVLEFLDCEPEFDLCSAFPRVACRLIRIDEPWKAGNTQGLRDCTKFDRAFDAATRSRIADALDEADWNALANRRGVIAASAANVPGS